jgi:hypothetical protein
VPRKDYELVMGKIEKTKEEIVKRKADYVEQMKDNERAEGNEMKVIEDRKIIEKEKEQLSVTVRD